MGIELFGMHRASYFIIFSQSEWKLMLCVLQNCNRRAIYKHFSPATHKLYTYKNNKWHNYGVRREATWKKNIHRCFFRRFCLSSLIVIDCLPRGRARERKAKKKTTRKWFSDKLSIKYGNSASCPLMCWWKDMHQLLFFSLDICIWHGVYMCVTCMHSHYGHASRYHLVLSKGNMRVENGSAAVWCAII